MKNNFTIVFGRWLPLAVGLTVVILFVYAAVQQSYRQSANDPQIQLAEDVGGLLNAGTPIQYFGSKTPSDFSKTLAPFMVIYDGKGNALTGTSLLNGKLPTLPAGVFASVTRLGEDRFTWEPVKGIRMASVVLGYKSSATTSGFVLVGRSLREVEKRESTLTELAEISWMLALGLSYLVTYFDIKFKNRGNSIT